MGNRLGKKILVLGGTGAMGKNVVRILAQKGYDVYVTSRKKREDEEFVKYYQGNAKNEQFISTVLSYNRWDAIVDFMVYSLEEFLALVDLFLSSTKQYIFISSARVYADSKGKKINEESPYLIDLLDDKEYMATKEYALEKSREERVLLKRNVNNWTIIHPSITYNSHRLQLGAYEKENWLYRVLHGRSIVFSKDLIDKQATLTFGDNVAEGIVATIDNKDCLGERYNVVGDKACTWGEVLQIYLETLNYCLGYSPKVVLTELSTNLHLPDYKYQVLYGRYYDRIFDNSKINTLLDTSTWLYPEKGLAYCLEEFLKNPLFMTINWQKEALLDRASKEWTPLKEIPGIKQKLQYTAFRLGMGRMYYVLSKIKNSVF